MSAVMKDDLYKHSKSIVLIKNPKTNTCFMKAFVLGLMQLENKKDDSYWRHPNTKKWTEEMNALHLVLSLTLTMNVGPQDMMELADSFQVIIRCFHVNGSKPGFFHALPKGNVYPCHLYFLFNSNHFNYKSKNVGCAEDFQTFTICMFLCTVQQGVFCKLRRTYVLKRRR